MYCVYTDTDVPESAGNLDHVFPLSLGGLDSCQIWADRNFNSDVGSRVDGAVANDFLVMFARQAADARGHTNKPPVPIFRKSKMDGKPVQVSFGKEKSTVWDAMTRKDIPDENVAGKLLSSEFKVDRAVTARFLAKVTLGAGYFIFADAFRKAVDCEELRLIINVDVARDRHDQRFWGMETKICDRWHPDRHRTEAGRLAKTCCEVIRRSIFIVQYSPASVVFHVGVLGQYIGSVIMPVKADVLPRDGGFMGGHVLVLGPGEMERMSLLQYLQTLSAIAEEARQAKEGPQSVPE
ncbi:MAG: hypothetical protein KG075_23405 [Alphaproteobacteria bacterium]|nr:hypothetical protein [Alphaproteobacteria bacterium]